MLGVAVVLPAISRCVLNKMGKTWNKSVCGARACSASGVYFYTPFVYLYRITARQKHVFSSVANRKPHSETPCRVTWALEETAADWRLQDVFVCVCVCVRGGGWVCLCACALRHVNGKQKWYHFTDFHKTVWKTVHNLLLMVNTNYAPTWSQYLQ